MKKSVLTAVSFLALTYSFAQTADEIISKHIEAVGGAEAWKKVTSIITKSTSTIKNPATGDELKMDLNISILVGKGYRMDLKVKNTDNYQLFTPTSGWSYMPIQGETDPKPLDAKEIADAQDNLLATDELMNAKQMGTKVELKGKETKDKIEYYKLKLTDKNNKETTMYVDMVTYQIAGTSTHIKQGDQEGDLVEIYSEYKKLPEGIVVPMNTKTTMFGELKTSSVEVNTIKDESIFTP